MSTITSIYQTKAQPFFKTKHIVPKNATLFLKVPSTNHKLILTLKTKKQQTDWWYVCLLLSYF